jgi:hypothetical protein
MISRRSIFFLPLIACAHGPTVPAVDPSKPPSNIWQKRAIDRSRDVIITADLRALLADSFFAPATRKAMRAAADRAVPSVNLKDAWEGARSAQVALLERGTVLVVLGEVPDIDPEGMTGFDGTWQWKRAPESPPGTLEYAFVPEAGSLFVLSDRTWVLGAGTAAQHARASLQEAGGHPVGAIDLARPIAMLVPESRLHVAEQRARPRELGSIFDGAKQVRLSATIGQGAKMFLDVDYDADASATNAATTFAEIVRAFQTNGPRSTSLFTDILRLFQSRSSIPLGFLATAKLSRDGSMVRLEAAIPAEILDALGSAESGLF